MQVLDDADIEKTLVERAPPQCAATAAGRPAAGQTRLGSGLVTDTIGTGGMASVYKVWNERLEVFRAVKLISLDAYNERFETEAKLTAKLRHPNIVEIYNVGEWNGMPYMEMEYIDGENLHQILSRCGRLPAAVCSAAAILMAEALAYAHNLTFTMGDKQYSGIIHRDLKPANIMFSKRGEVKLTDFGIARPAQTSLHTTEGNIVGTMHYLSPEQMDGRNVDAQSDIYSFGTLLYEMVTGVKTFPQERITELMKHRTANSFRKPTEHGFPISSALSGIILRCLELEPKNRYPDSKHLTESLQKAHASLTNLPPQTVLSGFYPKFAADTPRPPEIPEEEKGAARPERAKKQKKTRKTLPSRRILITATVTMSAMLLIPYLLISLITASTQKKQAQGERQRYLFADTAYTNTALIPDYNAGPRIISGQSAANETPALNAGSAQKTANGSLEINNTAYKQIPTSDPETPALSEDDLIRAATAAINRQEWDRAIRILERENAYKDNSAVRSLLLLEACIESQRFDKAQSLLDAATPANDAHYFLSAGKYWFYRGEHAKAIELLESSLIHPSVSKSRNTIFSDAMYYIAVARSERFRSSPSEAHRLSALDSWRRVELAYRSKPESPRYRRAGEEIAGLN